MVAHIFKRSLFVVHSKSLSLFRVFEREKVNYGNLFRQNIKRAPFKPWNIHTHTLYPAIESLWKFTSFIFLNEICLVDLLWTDDRIEHAAIVLNLEYVSTILFYFHHTFGIFLLLFLFTRLRQSHVPCVSSNRDQILQTNKVYIISSKSVNINYNVVAGAKRVCVCECVFSSSWIPV